MAMFICCVAMGVLCLALTLNPAWLAIWVPLGVVLGRKK